MARYSKNHISEFDTLLLGRVTYEGLAAVLSSMTDHVCVMGGAETVQQLLRVGLIDEMWIHLVPVLLGNGIHLFENIGPKQIELERARVVESPDVTHRRFSVLP